MATIFRGSKALVFTRSPSRLFPPSLSGILRLLTCLLLIFNLRVFAEHQDPVSSPGGTKQDPSKPSKDNSIQDTKEPEKPEPAAQADTEAGASPKQRTSLNLLGQIDSASGEGHRNENVQFNQIDSNALKELNLRLGAMATIIEEFAVDRGYFGAEYGNSPTPSLHARPLTGKGIHGNLFEMNDPNSLRIVIPAPNLADPLSTPLRGLGS